MPKVRVSTRNKAPPVRESPRKRKLDELALDSPVSAHAKPSSTNLEVANSAQHRKLQTKKSKADIVVDEPTRTEIATDAKLHELPVSIGITAIDRQLPNRAVLKEEPKANAAPRKATKKTLQKTEDPGSSSELEVLPKKRAARKTKEEREAEAMPLAARTKGLQMYVGAHVSIAKGVENAVTNALHIGGNAFALFLQSQRKWENPPLKEENRSAFCKSCTQHEFDPQSHVVPHGSYLVNLAAADDTKGKQSYDFFLNDLRRCEALGIKYYNFHPGATNKEPLNEAIARLAKRLNSALSETTTVIPVLENMAGTEFIIGSRFTDLRDVISQIKPEYQSRIGVCIDTCHAFAAGYDLRSPEAYHKTFKELDETVGLKYVKAMHINDSKGMFQSKKDLHQNIGLGFLGLRAFHNVMNDVRLQNVPMILETPCDRPDPSDTSGKKTIEDKGIYAREIKLLESLIGMDPDSEQFKKLEADLSEQGRAEREKMEKWTIERDEKARQKVEKEKARGQKNIKDMFGGKKTPKRKAMVESGTDVSDASDSDS